MSIEWIFDYNWQAAIVYVLVATILVRGGKFLAFKSPELQRMKEWNREEDKAKRANPKYLPIMRANAKVGSAVSLFILLILAPYFFTVESMPVWRYFVDIAIILLIYDFIYYLTHRFVFHHGGPLQKVHGLHHQARDISLIDASYVHPLETFIGLSIYVVSAIATSILMGEVHAAAAAIAFVIWSQVNTIVHTKFNLASFPYKTIDNLTSKHAVHHINMNRGNYSSVTLLFDWMFGTLESK